MTRRSRSAIVVLIGLLSGAVTFAAPSQADAIAYLVNVSVRPGYNFANADQALAYGNGICHKIGTGRTYGQIMGDVKSDFATTDEYQASYLITQAANELCPALIWDLRKSAAGYPPPIA